MRRKISKDNPFFHTPRFAFGYALLPEHARVLDFGCHDGNFGYLLKQHRNVDYIGVDKNRDAIKKAPDGIVVKELVHPLPFADGQFDAVTMFEVLEHIHDQDKALLDVFRVLKAGGLLLVSVPRRHVFSFMDLANLKFVFPGLHRWYYSLSRSPEAYRQRYVANPNGLVGDIEKEKLWHQHFKDNEMRNLLERNGFRVEEMDGAGLFSQLFTFAAYVLRLGFLFPQRVRDWDNHTFHYSSLFCAARTPK
jgi:SAM-dependent methyltransferase